MTVQNDSDTAEEPDKPDVGRNGVTIRYKGRGRPKGSTDKVPRKRRKKNVEASINVTTAAAAVNEANSQGDLEKGEEVEDCWLALSVATALKGPEAVQWMTAISKEILKPEAAQAWRALTDQELKVYK